MLCRLNDIGIIQKTQTSLSYFMKVSIITATYNSGKTLKDTLESVLHQSYADIEYIVVDGVSKDNTLDLLKQYEPLFKGKMKFISEPDKGLYDAMNKGIQMASGDIVGILNSDDFFNNEKIIEEVVCAIDTYHVDAVYGDVHYVHDNDLAKCVRYYSSKIFKPGLMRLGFMPAHPSFYCKTEVYRENGVFDTTFKQAADFELLLRLIYCKSIRTKYLPIDFVTMRTGGLSTSGFRSHKAIMKDHRKALRVNGVWSCYLLLALRYLYKMTELIASKFVRISSLPKYIKC